MADATDATKRRLRAAFDRGLKLESHGTRITSDGGPLTYPELEDALDLTATAAAALAWGGAGRTSGTGCSAYPGRRFIAGSPAMRISTAPHGPAAPRYAGHRRPQGARSAPGLDQPFEAEWLAREANHAALVDLSGPWINLGHARRPPHGIVLDLDSSESPTYGQLEGTACNNYCRCTCYHLLLCNSSRLKSGQARSPCLKRANRACIDSLAVGWEHYVGFGRPDREDISVTVQDAFRPLGRPLVNALRRLRYGRFQQMRMRTNGMLRPRTYKRLYEAIARSPDLDVVEVGAGAGASSIALAWAFRDYHRRSKLIVIEKCEGGSRTDFGDYQTNYTILRENLRQYGVAGYVRLYPRYLTWDTKDDVLFLIQTEQIAGLIHDADGRIDRDFSIFWPVLAPGGVIIIDDYEDKPEFQPISTRSPDGGTKKLTTYRLLNQFMKWDLFAMDYVIDGTAFGHKPPDADFGRFDHDQCAAIIDRIMVERRAHVR